MIEKLKADLRGANTELEKVNHESVRMSRQIKDLTEERDSLKR